MQPSFRIGRIAGIDVGANWSWLLVVALVVWSLAAGVFPATNPGLGDTAYVVMAVVAALLFFGSLLLHELGHAVQARREGMEIDGITLWVFGGVARFKGMFPSAEAELRIALAGPAVSLAIGVALLAFALLVPLPGTVDAVAFWLGQINIVLLIFNMLPALPLDGGRVLRAVLWRRRRDFGSATRRAAGLGRLFGQFLIAGGLALVLLGGAIGGIWIAFIGWFLLIAAESEAQVATSRQALAGVHVADVMARDPVTVEPDLPLDRFVDDVFLRHRHTAYPVTRDGEVVGLVSFRGATAVDRPEWASRRVEDVMVPVGEALVVSADTDLGEVLTELVQSDLNRALVCDGGALRGLLSITDASRVLEVRAARAPVD